ncbi:tRNA lysidine(34) synthetase TilS [Altererythrobacter sp. MF3-039]|uniref:tRNA lysidine(34) synthetase TilS n=1 Tax=Altererythrobacter sp. MF3-039 TaxID=3252901 RepID=UPI00390CA820
MAVSGGPDSLALLLLAAHAMPGRITVASVDHQLREESGAECALVADLCAKLEVPHETLAVKVAGGNLQQEARAARYVALAQWAVRNSLNAVLTAHHADDQAETLVMRLNRSSGLSGLAGVRRTTSIPGTDIPLLRPLLGWRKAELELILSASGVAAAQDPSNTNEQFDRARIRKALSEADWLDIEAVAASASNLADAEEALVWAAEREWTGHVHAVGGTLEYQSYAPLALQLRVVARMIEEIAEPPRLGALARLMRETGEGEQVNIAGAMLARTSDGWFVTKEPARRG